MTKALKIVLVVWSVIHIVLGVAFIFLPGQTAAVMGFGKLDSSSIYLGALCGIMFLAASIWLIAATKDIRGNILWVNFAVLWASLGVAVQLYLVITGTLGFGQAAYGLIQDFVFLVLFLVFYPYPSTPAA